MHLTTVSALAVQIGLVAASVIAGAAPDSHDIMGLRDWRETMVASLQQAQARYVFFSVQSIGHTIIPITASLTPKPLKSEPAS